MRERLSNQATIFFKLLAPAYMAVAIPIAVIKAIVGGDLELETLPFQIFGLAAAVAIVVRFLVPLKNVVAVEDGLIVDNFITVSKIRYEDILDVREGLILQHQTTVRLRRPGPFGTRITYLPYLRFPDFSWKDHPATRLIKERIGQK